MTTATATHVFELSNNGKAPFRFVGQFSLPSASLAGANPVAYNNALAMIPRGIGAGSCAHCGMAIVHNFIIESSDKRRFVVGCECVNKTGDAGLIAAVKAERKRMAAEKRAERRNTKHAERQAAWAAERAARAADFVVTHAALIARAEGRENPFIQDVISGGKSGRFISERAIDAVTRVLADLEQRDAWRINSRHVGTVGKRQSFTVTVSSVNSYSRPSFSGFGYDTVWIITMRDEAGNAIVSKSVSFYAEKGETFTMKATPKEHSEYRGEQQTIVQRIKRAD